MVPKLGYVTLAKAGGRAVRTKKVASSATRPPRRIRTKVPSVPAPQVATSEELVMVRGEASMRVFIHLLLNFLHRADRERRAFYGMDLDMAAIAETVAIAALEAEMRDPAFREAFGDYNTVVGIGAPAPDQRAVGVGRDRHPARNGAAQVEGSGGKRRAGREGRRLHLQAGSRADAAAPGSLRARHEQHGAVRQRVPEAPPAPTRPQAGVRKSWCSSARAIPVAQS